MTLVLRPSRTATSAVTDRRTPVPAERSYQLPIVREIAIRLVPVDGDDCW